MVRLKRLAIIFDEGKVTYRPGETVSGEVILENSKDLIVKGVHAKFKGKAEVTMFVGDYDTQKECYFSEDLLLSGSMPHDPGESMTMTPGTYQYPFKYTLPNKLPSSFACEGDENGRVVYTVEAIVHRPGNFSYAKKEAFKVVTSLNLNQFPNAAEAVSGDMCKALTFLCLNMGTISASFSLPHKGYTPGEAFPITCHIVNDSKRRIKKIYFSLQQKVTLRVYGSSVMRTLKVSTGCFRDSVPPGGSDSFGDKSIIVPETPPSFLLGCRLIDVQYVLKLNVVPAGLFSRRLSIPLNIIIGTEPLRRYADSPRDVSNINVIEDTKRTSVMFDYGSKV